MNNSVDHEHPAVLPIWASIASGALAGGVPVFISNMPETLKTRMQLDGEATHNGHLTQRQYVNFMDALRKTVKHEGLRGLQSGLGAALSHQIIVDGLRLGLFEPLQTALRRLTGSSNNNFLVKIVSGALTGQVGVIVASPFYLAKNRLQAQSPFFRATEEHHYKNTIDCLLHIFHRDGLRGLFHGVGGALPRAMVGSATQLAFYDTIKVASIERFGMRDGLPAHLTASFLSSLVTATFMNPFDVISTRMYQSSGLHTVYKNVSDCFAKTIKAEGWRALQKGWLPLYIRLGPQTMLTFVLWEKMKKWFH